MASMLLRVILPEGEALKPRVVQIPSPRGANGKEWAVIMEVDEGFVWHQPMSGGAWIMDCRAMHDTAKVPTT